MNTHVPAESPSLLTVNINDIPDTEQGKALMRYILDVLRETLACARTRFLLLSREDELRIMYDGQSMIRVATAPGGQTLCLMSNDALCVCEHASGIDANVLYQSKSSFEDLGEFRLRKIAEHCGGFTPADLAKGIRTLQRAMQVIDARVDAMAEAFKIALST